jgi:hypothetical protein
MKIQQTNRFPTTIEATTIEVQQKANQGTKDVFESAGKNSKDTESMDQMAEDQQQKYSDAKDNFKKTIEMMQDYMERQRAALSKIRS